MIPDSSSFTNSLPWLGEIKPSSNLSNGDFFCSLYKYKPQRFLQTTHHIAYNISLPLSLKAP